MRSKYGSILSNDPEHRHRARPQRDVCPKSILFCARPSYRSRASTGNNSLNPVTAGGHRFAAAVAADDDDDDDNSYRRIAQSTDDDVNIYIHLKLQLRLVRARRSIKLSPGEIDTANRRTRRIDWCAAAALRPDNGGGELRAVIILKTCAATTETAALGGASAGAAVEYSIWC